MGLKILKPEIYLGKKKFLVKNIRKNSANDIYKKIGFKFIHIEDQKNIYEMAQIASSRLLKKQKVKPDFLILVSQTQENKIPSCAEKLAKFLGMKDDSIVLTLSSGCSGFVQALFVANKILSGKFKRGLIVCVEKYSSIIKEKDFKTKVLFSDAASATMLVYHNQKNLLHSSFGYDGENSSALETVFNQGKENLKMNGNKLLLFSLNKIPKIIKFYKKKIGIIDMFLIHPGSKILHDSIIQKSGIPPSKSPNTFSLTGNTVSSSIPLLIKENFKSFKKNNKILLTGFGVGLSHATVVLKWI